MVVDAENKSTEITQIGGSPSQSPQSDLEKFLIDILLFYARKESARLQAKMFAEDPCKSFELWKNEIPSHLSKSNTAISPRTSY